MFRAIWLTPLALALCISQARAAIKTETVDYVAGGNHFKGVLAYDDAAKEARPGVLVGPEWWGVTDYPRTRAKQLAELGYVAFVLDPYGDGFTTNDPAEANKRSSALKKNLKELRLRAEAALETIKKNPKVEPNNIAAVGYCFGGTIALELARGGELLKGVVCLHGALDTLNQEEEATHIKTRILVCQGAEDPFETPEVIGRFQKALRDAKVDWQFNIYSGAQHAFTNPLSDTRKIPGIAYNAKADARSFIDEKEFLKDVLGK